MAGGTPAFPALRVLGARASRSHGVRNTLFGGSASRHARKKPTPLSLQVPPASRGEPSRAPDRFPLLAGGTLRRGFSFIRAFTNSGCAIGMIRVHRLGSLGAKRSRFFALTPSPSPTLWERGAGAHSGAPSPLKGVGFFSRGWQGGRDARVPSVARAGSASVSLAWR
jgi:hypothetical protein